MTMIAAFKYTSLAVVAVFLEEIGEGKPNQDVSDDQTGDRPKNVFHWILPGRFTHSTTTDPRTTPDRMSVNRHIGGCPSDSKHWRILKSVTVRTPGALA